VSPVKYELGFYITEDDILHSHRRDNLKSYVRIHVCVYGNTHLLAAVLTRRPEVEGTKKTTSWRIGGQGEKWTKYRTIEGSKRKNK
jgi:hypothetical protein